MNRTDLPTIHIVGRRNAGKTTLVCDLVSEFTSRGISVATVKHTHHQHELDTPGKDSFLHRQAGASAVGILSPHMTAVFLPADRDSTNTDPYAKFASVFPECRLLIVEGDLHRDAHKIEVWRSEVSEPPYASTEDSILAVISNDRPECECPVWSRSNIVLLADEISRITKIDP